MGRLPNDDPNLLKGRCPNSLGTWSLRWVNDDAGGVMSPFPLNVPRHVASREQRSQQSKQHINTEALSHTSLTMARPSLWLSVCNMSNRYGAAMFLHGRDCFPPTWCFCYWSVCFLLGSCALRAFAGVKTASSCHSFSPFRSLSH